MDVFEKALELHKTLHGKIKIELKGELNTLEDLSLAYSPGVAAPCMEIHKNPETVYDYTAKGNMVAIVTDGSAVLGLGNIGAAAAIPVMEGKAALFKRFANIDAFPICIDSQDKDEIIRTVKLIAPMFGGINLEDISAPKCFEVEAALRKELDIPVFHDDQHGTAIVVLSGLVNALKVTQRNIEDVKIVVNGLGAAGIAIINLLRSFGAKHFALCDRPGLVYEGDLADVKNLPAFVQEHKSSGENKGSLATALTDAHVFIGVSAANVVTGEMVQAMHPDPIVFALANPNPEIAPELALKAGAKIVATGRTDYPNQVNNVLAFPGIFRGALDARASEINEEMKIAAVHAISQLIPESELSVTNIIPSVFNEKVVAAVSEAVKKAAIASGVSSL